MLPCSCSPGLNTADFWLFRLEEPGSQGKDFNFRNRGSAHQSLVKLQGFLHGMFVMVEQLHPMAVVSVL